MPYINLCSKNSADLEFPISAESAAIDSSINML